MRTQVHRFAAIIFLYRFQFRNNRFYYLSLRNKMYIWYVRRWVLFRWFMTQMKENVTDEVNKIKFIYKDYWVNAAFTPSCLWHTGYWLLTLTLHLVIIWASTYIFIIRSLHFSLFFTLRWASVSLHYSLALFSLAWKLHFRILCSSPVGISINQRKKSLSLHFWIENVFFFFWWASVGVFIRKKKIGKNGKQSGWWAAIMNE